MIHSSTHILSRTLGDDHHEGSAIAQFGLESVLVAVDLVLESGLPSAEHIENMLNRLKLGPIPPPVETQLTISEAPIAAL